MFNAAFGRCEMISNKQKNSIIGELRGTKYEELSKLLKFNKLKFSDCDTNQLNIKLEEDVYLFSQADTIKGTRKTDYRSEILDFKDFSSEEQKAGISGFYASIDEVKEIYGDAWKMIVMECSFEQNY